MSYQKMDINKFLEDLASSNPVPGGGGASALVGAIGTSCANMLASLTSGKEKYASLENEICSLLSEMQTLRLELCELIDEDAKAFEPLSKAYKLAKDDPVRKDKMEQALKTAALAPFEIIKTVCKAIDCIEAIAKIGTPLALSDAGVGALCCKAALQSAAINVYVNTKSIQDLNFAKKMNKQVQEAVDKYCAKADEIYAFVMSKVC